jgi:hypothetical protein
MHFFYQACARLFQNQRFIFLIRLMVLRKGVTDGGVVRYSDYDLPHSQNIFLSTCYTFKRSLRLIITAVRTMKNDNVCYRLIS